MTGQGEEGFRPRFPGAAEKRALAEGVEVPRINQTESLGRLTPTKGSVEKQRLFGALANDTERPPDPGNGKRRPAGNGTAPSKKAQGRAKSQYQTPDAVARDFPHSARVLSVYDGQRLCGRIVDTREQRPRAPQAPSFAFDDQDRPLGSFPTRRIAAAAIAARDHGNVSPQPVSLQARAKAAERDWRKTLKAKDRKSLPAPVDRAAAGGKVRVKQANPDKAKRAYLRHVGAS